MNKLVMRFDLKQSRNNLWNTKCVICGDSKRKSSKKRMYFILRENKVHVYCHNCGYSRNLYGFLEDKAPDLLDEYKFYGFSSKPKFDQEKIQELKEIIQKPKKIAITVDELLELTLGFHELRANHPARKYVEHRQIPFRNVRYCINFRVFYKELKPEDHCDMPDVPCMLIPFYRKDKPVEILQARFFDPKIKPKYLTVKLNPDALKVYNGDYIDQNQLIWILEGPIDSMFVPNAIAMAGSDLSFSGDICWVYDNEPGNDEIVNKMIKKLDKGDKVVIWQKTDNFKDINEGIVKKVIDKDSVYDILRERIQEGLMGKLKLAEWRK